MDEAVTPTLNFSPLGSPSLSGVVFKVTFRFAMLVMSLVKNPPDLTTFSQALPGLSSSILPLPDRKDFLKVPMLLGNVSAKMLSLEAVKFIALSPTQARMPVQQGGYVWHRHSCLCWFLILSQLTCIRITVRSQRERLRRKKEPLGSA